MECMLAGLRSVHPLLAEELGLRLYSAEELCYYVVQFYPMLEETFFSERLFEFLGQECGQESLAQRLCDMKKKSCTLEECVLILLREIHYYDDREIAEFRRQMTAFARQESSYVFLARMQILLERGNYGKAAAQYCDYLEKEEFQNQSKTFRGTLYYNLGVCMVHLNNFRQAMQYFLCAWQQEGCPLFKQALVQLAWMEEMPIPEEVQDAITEGELFDWKREYRIAMRESDEEVEAEYGNNHMESLEDWIERQKDNYRRELGE